MHDPGMLAPRESQHSPAPHSVLSTQPVPKPPSSPGNPPSVIEPLQTPLWQVCVPRQLTQAAPGEPWPQVVLLKLVTQVFPLQHPEQVFALQLVPPEQVPLVHDCPAPVSQV